MPTLPVPGAQLSYTDTGGSGVALLLLHAWPLHGGMWEPQLDVLAERARLLVPDLKGFGRSEAPEDVSAYSMRSYADEAAALLDHAGIDGAVVAGLSLGGYIAFEFLRRFPDRVNGLILADTRAEADGAEARQRRSSQQQELRSEGTAGLIESLPDALLGATTRQKRPDVVRRVKTLMDNPAAGYIGALEAMKGRRDSTGDLAGIAIPCLVLVGEEDTLTPPDAAKAIAGGIASAELALLPEAGHLSNLEAPEAFNGAVLGFLDRL